MPPPVLVLEPSRVWHLRALWFSLAFLVVIIAAGFYVPLVLILAPFVLYRGLHAFRFLQPGRVGIFIYEDRIVCKPAFGKQVTVSRAEVLRFLAVYHGTTEVVVARREDVDVRGTENRPLIHKSDIIMPSGLMRNPGLVRRLEAWRTENLASLSLMPTPP